MTETFVHSVAAMDTVVTIQIVGHGSSDTQRRERENAALRAVEWFREVERVCSRFNTESEISKLSLKIGQPVAVSPMAYETVQFALAVAADTDGAFDPTVGLLLESSGFDREYTTGATVQTPLDHDAAVSFRDVRLDAANRTITLRRPMLLDLGAVAKGLAIDMAVRELASFENFVVDAGGDLYLAGCNAAGAPWSVGIRHPRDGETLIETVHVSNTAVCTSGDYERRSPVDGQLVHHIVDPRRRRSASASASATVLAPSAMVADAVGTAAFVLGPVDGLALLERHGLEGLIITPELDRVMTPGFSEFSRVQPVSGGCS